MTDSHKTVQYQLRLSPELRERLKQSAEQHNRSMNADIVARIEHSFNSLDGQDVMKALAELKAEIQSLKR